MQIISFILNLPYTIIGILVALSCRPIGKVTWQSHPCAVVFNVKSFWWAVGYMKHARAATIGHVVLLGPNLEKNDLEHELIHVEQYSRLPIIFPFLYYTELFRKGYKKNKYEDEAYTKAGNIYKEK